jgi:hypothetical protein
MQSSPDGYRNAMSCLNDQLRQRSSARYNITLAPGTQDPVTAGGDDVLKRLGREGVTSNAL